NVIDVAEYYGGDELKSATEVRYVQLKHSTQRVDVAVAPSELSRTINEYTKKYAAIFDDDQTLTTKVWFEFLTNRPIHAGIRKALTAVVAGSPWNADKNTRKLRSYAKRLSNQQARAFYARLRLTGDQPNLWFEERGLGQDAMAFLPGGGGLASVALEHLIAITASDRR
ncbi:hypothetical protein, partial [Parvularcula oceani]|uniref:hypothetical protein n=1 Tax=Parvularcula oceani TaxID=1247963 RepID=UPI001EE22D1B